MIEAHPLRVDSVRAQQREDRWTSVSAYLAVVGGGLLLGLARYGSVADPWALAAMALVCVVAAILIRPISGVYLTLFFSVVGDRATMDGYPFNINFSSWESILFVADSLTFTPLELCLALTAMGWFFHSAGARIWRLLGRPLLWPVLAFGGFVLLGLVWGVGVRGGLFYIALWEIRPVLYVVAMFLLASNLLTRPAHYVSLAWVVVAAISIQNLFAINYYHSLPGEERELLETLTDHHNSLFYAWMILLTLALWVLRNCSREARVLLLLAAIPSTYVFVLSQRRAAFLALVAALFALALVLFFRRRKAFFVFVPILLILGTAYTAAFWGATDGVGFGARAIKSVIAPGDVSERDAASNLYRDVENFNLVYTIRAEPLTGVGFGSPFYQPAQLPDISFFIFYEYIPHNSMLWIWLKTGYFGFVALLFVIAVALRAGIHASMKLPSGNTLAVTVAAMGFVVMFVVFAYVDIVWAPSSCVFLAVCLATCSNIVRRAENSDEIGGEDRDERSDENRDEIGGEHLTPAQPSHA